MRRRTWSVLHRSTTIQVHRLSASLMIVNFVSVQRLRCGYHKKLNTCAVTLVLPTAPSPIDAFLVPCVNPHSFGSCLCRLHIPSNYNSSKMCSIEANTGSMGNDGQVMRHFCQWNCEGMSFDFSCCVLRTREIGFSWMRLQLGYAFAKSAYYFYDQQSGHTSQMQSVFFSCFGDALAGVLLGLACFLCFQGSCWLYGFSCWTPCVFWVVLQLKVASKNTLNTFTQE